MKVFNSMLQKYIITKDGEELCSKCNGKGQIPLINTETNTVRYYLRCDRCGGYGKLDWIEKIVGHKYKPTNYIS